jgi:hypothetical protein
MWHFGTDSWAQSKQFFADQFELNGDAYLYRRSQKGAPIRVSAEERQRFIDDYARRLRYSTWGIVGGLIVVIALSFWWTLSTASELPDAAMYAAIGAVAVACVGYAMWVQGAPARELARRTPVGRERTREEMRRVLLARTTYRHLAALALTGAVLPLTLRSQRDLLHGWGRLWLGFSAIVIILVAATAFRKWRMERGHD